MPKQKLSESQLADIGGKLVNLYETGYLTRGQAFKFSFLKGLVGGFGAFLGGTILIALLLWTLSLLSGVPVVDHIVRSIQNTLQSQ